jgi:manganese transport protein
MSGQVIMEGFVDFRIPLWVRRLVTMVPAFAVILAGVDATKALVLSQVVLSFGIPLALVPLQLFTDNKEVMGDFANRRWVRVSGWVIVAVVIALNLWLVVQSFVPQPQS